MRFPGSQSCNFFSIVPSIVKKKKRKDTQWFQSAFSVSFHFGWVHPAGSQKIEKPLIRPEPLIRKVI
jgi:hypothetical protein